MISDSELSELISVPKEWRSGEERIVWPRSHDKFNVDWLENLWKYLAEYCKADLTMMENFNIVYTLQALSGAARARTTAATTKDDLASRSLVLYKLHRNSSLVYAPPYDEPVEEVASDSAKPAAESPLAQAAANGATPVRDGKSVFNCDLIDLCLFDH